MSSILVIDDNGPLLEMMTTALRLQGYHVLAASDGKTGLRLLAGHQVDLVITDIVMPDQDGIETMMILRKSHPALPIIAISGDAPARTALYLNIAQKLGAVQTLTKPFLLPALLAAVRRALGR